MATKNDKTYSVELPHTVDLSNLPTPQIVVSQGAKHDLSETQIDFSKTVTITVTAQDGKIKKQYPLTVSRKPAFRSVWETTEANQEITLPIHEAGQYNFTVDWGDGSSTKKVTTHDGENHKHTYTEAKEHTITITGKLVGFNFKLNKHSKNNFISVEEWGDIALGVNRYNNRYYGNFADCENLRSFTEKDAPDLTQTHSLVSLFYGAENFNSDISHWETKYINNMSYMFSAAITFNNGATAEQPNKPLTFNTSSVTDMYGMFEAANAFNQDISKWNTFKVEDMEYMFLNAVAFNQNIGDWNTAKVTNMDGMFSGAEAFNQNLSGWCVKQITNKPTDFDRLAHKDFANKADRQPKWNEDIPSCPTEK